MGQNSIYNRVCCLDNIRLCQNCVAGNIGACNMALKPSFFTKFSSKIVLWILVLIWNNYQNFVLAGKNRIYFNLGGPSELAKRSNQHRNCKANSHYEKTVLPHSQFKNYSLSNFNQA